MRELFYEHDGRQIHKWDHYFEIYERYFSKYRGADVNILEIGISHGGSLQLWKKYFGEHVKIFAIDLNPECEKLKEENTTIFIGSQSDSAFLREIITQMPQLDIIIDDGGHTMNQQKIAFECLYLKVKDGGVYLVEDTHTSYLYKYHGGYKKASSFIEYSKDLIDSLYVWHIEGKPRVILNEITKNIGCITFFEGIVVFEKENREKPFDIKKGIETTTWMIDESLKKETLIMKFKRKLFGHKIH